MKRIHKTVLISLAVIISILIILIAIANIILRPPALPSARSINETEKKLATSLDLKDLSTDFEGSVGNLTNYEPRSTNDLQIKNSELVIQNTSRYPIWYSDQTGPFVYEYVSGDFMIETKVTSRQRNDLSKQSNQTYSSGGLVIRDPSSIQGSMKWIVYNLGYQDGFFGTELKTTTPSTGFNLSSLIGTSSNSVWYSNKVQDSSNQASLRTCRIGNEIRSYSRFDDKDAWLEQQYTSTTLKAGSGVAVQGAEINKPLRLIRSDFANTLQVGLMTNDGSGQSESAFDYFNVSRIQSFDVCIK
jgi:regulation of enolase protein 1 (concanavalin A-like superfamily)